MSTMPFLFLFPMCASNTYSTAEGKRRRKRRREAPKRAEQNGSPEGKERKGLDMEEGGKGWRGGKGR